MLRDVPTGTRGDDEAADPCKAAEEVHWPARQDLVKRGESPPHLFHFSPWFVLPWPVRLIMFLIVLLASTELQVHGSGQEGGKERQGLLASVAPAFLSYDAGGEVLLRVVLILVLSLFHRLILSLRRFREQKMDKAAQKIEQAHNRKLVNVRCLTCCDCENVFHAKVFISHLCVLCSRHVIDLPSSRTAIRGIQKERHLAP